MKVCIITGASSGLGEKFLKNAVSLIPADEFWIIARSADKLEALKNEYPQRIRSIPLDLTSAPDIESFYRTVVKEKPEIIALINNAGFGKLGNIWDIPYNDQCRMISLNCGALTAFCDICIPFMQSGSFIINVGSIAAFAPNPRLSCYSATKAFVASFTEGLRFELKAKGINALVCFPGPMNTAFLPNADIVSGASHTFDTLPYCDPDKVSRKAIVSAMKGKAFYTPTFFYKFYRFFAKVLPVRLVMHFSKA